MATCTSLIQVKPHKFFRRRENDILLDLDVNVAQAALGAEVEVPTVDGPAKLKIPAGTQPGKVLAPARQGRPAPARQRARRPAGGRQRRSPHPSDRRAAQAVRAAGQEPGQRGAARRSAASWTG